MRYSSALVLGTLVAGQAAAANVRNAGFHARRQAEKKRDANYDNVDWSTVAYDLSGVDWSSVFASTQTPTSTPAPSSSEVVHNEAVSTPAYTTPAAATTTEAAAPSTTESSGNGNDISGSALTEGVVSFLTGIGAHGVVTASAPTTKNNALWLGDDSPWKTTFINDGSENIVLVCWTGQNMYISDHQPDLSINLPAGEQTTVSFADLQDGVSGGCAPAYKDTQVNFAGLLGQTWLEFTFKKRYGTFDISKEVFSQGVLFTAKGSKCTSDATTCVFQCVDSSAQHCEDTGTYEIINCSAANGGGAGTDPHTGGASGGCNMGEDSEHIKVTFN